LRCKVWFGKFYIKKRHCHYRRRLCTVAISVTRGASDRAQGCVWERAISAISAIVSLYLYRSLNIKQG